MDFEKDHFDDETELSPLEEEEVGGDADEIVETEEEELIIADDDSEDQAPAHRVVVDGFWIDRHPVTNAQFRMFVEKTGYVTFAEIPASAPVHSAMTREAAACRSSISMNAWLAAVMASTTSGAGLLPPSRG